MKYTVAQVFSSGSFNGTAEFTSGPFQGIQFGFTGTATSGGAIRIDRDVGPGIGVQTASDPAFQIISNECVWAGTTTGPGMGSGQPFELRVPSLVKTGDYPGLFAGHQMTFDFQQIFPGGSFNGVATFNGGPFGGQQFGFAGLMTGLGGIRIDRSVSPTVGSQHAYDPTPSYVGSTCVWQGNTTGVGIPPGGLPFKLTVPL